MQIFIKSSQQETALVLPENASIDSLKQAIFNQTMISQDCQILTHNGQLLEDLSTVEELDTIYMTLPVEGGKKKKKVYTTKKKNKHKHIKEKLATLRYYTVDAAGKVNRTRKTCPQCLSGVFMAKHMDRHYCGRCHTTLRLDPATVKAAQEAYKKKLADKKAAEQAALAAAAEAKKGKDSKKGKKK